MFLLISARAFCATGLSLLFIIGSLGVSGLAIWKETSTDFPSGDNQGTATEGQNLVLGPDPSLPENWTKVGDAAGPQPRAGPLMVHDAAAGRQVLFGGSSDGLARNDTWSYDPGRDEWTMLEPPGAPSARNGSALAYCTADNAALLFGGNDGTDQNDTWTYSSAQNLWQRLEPASAPAPRSGHALAFDSGAGKAVLLGGRQSAGPGQEEVLADTWTYDPVADDWSNVSKPLHPLSRYGHAQAYDPVNRLVVMFGGRNESAFFSDTWTLDVAAGTWTNRNPPTSPPARSGHSLAFDAGSGMLVLFGGADQTRSYNDTWAYNCSGNTWTRKILSGGPSARQEQAMTFDPASGCMVLFGGRDGYGVSQDDTWRYEPGTNAWKRAGRPSVPFPRAHHSMAYSTRDRLTLLFGGTDTVRQFNDTWLYNSSSGAWTAVQAPEAPSPRHDQAMAFDGSTGSVLLFGGLSGNGYENDTWTFNFTSERWARVPTADAPRPGSGYLLAFDSYVGKMVLFGGRNDTDLFNETWTYDPAAAEWTGMGPSPSPPPRDDGMMAFDSGRFRMVLFGGSGPSGALDDTWTYFLVTNSWTRMAPATAPPGRTDGAMTYNPGLKNVVLFGGLNGGQPQNDTWTYSILDDAWTDISPARSPAPRFGHDLVFDEKNGLYVLFGGIFGGSARAQTWVLGLHGRLGSGTYTSRPTATGGYAYFGSLQWESTAPAGTSVRLQLRTAATEEGLGSESFLGPDGTSGTFYTASNTRLPPAHNGSAWVQYRAFLDSGTILATPQLKSVSLSYNLLHTLRLAAPAGGENWTGLRNIDWEISDTDGDQILVDLYLLDGIGAVPLAVGIPGGDGTFPWDTTEFPNGTYRIRAVARDDNALIPLKAEAVSPGFTLSHPPGGPPPPPVNHQPVVLLSYPADGSVINTMSARLIWNATDPDGDLLTYRVLLETARFDVRTPPLPFCVTSGQFMDIADLVNGQTYYWSVIAGDGRSNGTTEVWHFTIRLGPVNLPPRISSIPPAEATPGVEYVYQIWAYDPEGDPLTYSLTSRPAGMSINATTGRLAWIPPSTIRGNFTVVVNVSDGRLGFDSQTFNITVREPPQLRPVVTILHPNDGWRVRGNLRITGLAANGSAPLVNVQVRLDGGPWLLANGTASWSFELDTGRLQNGRHSIEVRSFDGNGYSDLSVVGFFLNNPEPEPTLDGFGGNYLALGLWALAGIVLFWELRRHPERPPPMG